MKIRMLTVLIVLSLGWMILAVEGFSATKKSKDVNWSRPISELAPAPETGVLPGAPYKYSTGGIKYNLFCTDIMSQAGTIIQHDQIGDSWWDCQQNQSMGRMISVTKGGHRHFSWMYSDHPGASGSRYVDANCKDSLGSYLGPRHADGGDTRAGYSNQTHLHDGTSVIVYHRTLGTPIWYSALTMDDGICTGSFSRHWDIPDYFWEGWFKAGWPKAEVLYDSTEGRDYIHIVMSDFSAKSPNAPMKAVYERCYLGLNDTLICESYVDGSTRTYKIAKNVTGPGSFAPIGVFDTTCSANAMVTVSPVSQRVCIAYLRPAGGMNCGDYMTDACYIESMNNGDDWTTGNPWPPPEYNITNFGTTGNERALSDLSACYDFQDSLHIVYMTAGFDPANPGTYDPHVARLYHWSKKTGISMISSAIWGGTTPSGYYSANIVKMSVSAQDPIYHPGGDSVFLYSIWTQFDSADNAANGFTNGELYGSSSFDGGSSWCRALNLTNTRTPGCAPGSCLSESWSSLAANMYDGDLHIQYICDRDAGTPITDASQWTDNPVMYLCLHPPLCAGGCEITYRIEPASWYEPPLKVTPGGSRDLILKLFNVGTGNCTYSVISDDPCIQAYPPSDTLAPGDSATMTIVVSGAGVTFIDGNVFIIINGVGKIWILPVQAIVANDYYECPKDPATHDSLDNGVLAMYMNVNSQERIWDVSAVASADTFSTFFQGGTIVATTRLGDTLVGRYMGSNDQHNGAQDIFYRKTDLLSTDNFWCVYTQGVFMHNFEPPMDIKWYWWQLNKEIIFFKSTAPDALKHTVINFVTVERKDPPTWWPEHPTFTAYDNTYIGMAMDIDCPYDTILDESGRNRAGYDATNNIAWQSGFGVAGDHPQYNHYYAGMALAQGRQAGESTVPYSTHNVKNNQYLYPTSPWGWIDQELYNLAADPTIGYVQDGPPSPDSVVDRSQIVTARKISAGTNANARASFTIIEAIAPSATKGLADLQAIIAEAQAWVATRPLILCGDVNNSGSCELGDVVYLISYLYKNGPPPPEPLLRADCNNNCQVELGDVVCMISTLYKNGPLPLCCGVW